MWYDKNMEQWMDEEMVKSFIEDVFTDISYDDYAEQCIEDTYPNVEMFGVKFSPVEIIKRLDPYLFDEIVDEERQHDIDEMVSAINRYAIDEGDTLQLYTDIEDENFRDVVWMIPNRLE